MCIFTYEHTNVCLCVLYTHIHTYIHKLVILLLKGISDKIHFTIDIKAERLSVFLTHNANCPPQQKFVTREL